MINNCEVYDPQTDTWTEAQPMKSARCGFAAVAIWSVLVCGSRAKHMVDDSLCSMISVDLLCGTLPGYHGWLSMSVSSSKGSWTQVQYQKCTVCGNRKHYHTMNSALFSPFCSDISMCLLSTFTVNICAYLVFFQQSRQQYACSVVVCVCPGMNDTAQFESLGFSFIQDY